ncbi:DNA-3-methyladenine glycosylase [Kribbella sp. NPDC000426]|uniref:DNA-3-methyladenine glycosylase n=1 Tax=Kribbella sp. NPDC000426 TaxID=3154255 RepID=UPI003323488E
MGQPHPTTALANSPGKLCKSFQITKALYGADLTGEDLFLDDWGFPVTPPDIHTTTRIDLNPHHDGHATPLRHHLTPTRDQPDTAGTE